MSSEWRPGDIALVCASSLITRANSNVQMWTYTHLLGVIVGSGQTFMRIKELDDGLVDVIDYLVLITGCARPLAGVARSGLYYVPSERLLDLTELSEPGRLFGTQRLRE